MIINQELIDGYFRALLDDSPMTLGNFANSKGYKIKDQELPQLYAIIRRSDIYPLLIDNSIATQIGKIPNFLLTLEAERALLKFETLHEYLNHKNSEEEKAAQQKASNIFFGNTISDSIINQGSFFDENNQSNNAKSNHPIDTPHKTSNHDVWEKAKTIATILGFLTASIGVITKLMDLW